MIIFTCISKRELLFFFLKKNIYISLIYGNFINCVNFQLIWSIYLTDFTMEHHKFRALNLDFIKKNLNTILNNKKKTPSIFG